VENWKLAFLKDD
jgi:hypothetical protein